MRYFCFVALLLNISSYSLAASFDCNNASTNIEKMICSNNELSSLDEELSGIYKSATLKDVSIKQSQREWIKQRNNCDTDSCIIENYKKRIDELKLMLNHSDNVSISEESSIQEPNTIIETEAATNAKSEPQIVLEPTKTSKNVAPVTTTIVNTIGDLMPTVLTILIIGGIVVIYFGVSYQCPRCRKWFRTRETGRHLISENNGRKTVNREDRHRNAQGKVVSTVSRKEQIDIVVKKYQVSHKCNACNFTWDSIKSKEVEL